MAIKYDKTKFNLAKNDVIQASTYINEALLSSQTTAKYVPSDFNLKNILYQLPNDINNIKDRIIGLTNLLNSSENMVNQTNTISPKGRNLLEELNVSISNLGRIDNFATATGAKSSISSTVKKDDINDFFSQLGSVVISGMSSILNGSIDLSNNFNSFIGKTSSAFLQWGEAAWSNIKATGAELAKGAQNLFNGVLDIANQVIPKVWDFLKCTGATIAMMVLSLQKGLQLFAEALLDFLQIIGTVLISIPTLIIDGVAYLFGNNLGLTKGLWDRTMSSVSYKIVDNLHSSFYNENPLGKWLSKNSVSWMKPDSVGTNVLSGIGYVAGIVVLTISTGGLGAATAAPEAAAGATTIASTFSTTTAGIFSAMAGMGKGTEEALNNIKKEWEAKGGIGDWLSTENILKSIGYGTLNGTWEGVQWLIGGKIGTTFFTKGITVASKFGNSFIKMGLESLTGAVEAPARSLMTMTYNGKSFEQSWQDIGGWKGLFTNAGIAAISSLIGEATIFKNLKPKQANANVIDDVINKVDESYILTKKIDEYNKLLDIANSNEYKNYMDNVKKGNAQVLRSDFNNIEKRIRELELDVISTAYGNGKKFKTSNDVIDFFGDPKYFLVTKAKKLISDMNVPQETRDELFKEFNYSRTGDVNMNDLYNKMKKYMLPEDIKKYNELIKNYNSSSTGLWLNQLTDSEKTAIYLETKNGGFHINNCLRGKVDPDILKNFGLDTSQPGSLKQLSDLIYQQNYRSTNIMNSEGKVITDYIDSALDKYYLPETATFYRGVNDFGNIKFEDLVPGQKITDSAYLSCSALEYASFDKDVILELTVPPGKYGAFVEPIAGDGVYKQMEFKLKRNTTFIVTDTYIDAVTNKKVVKAIVVPTA